MSYQVTINSRNILVPIALEDRHGERITGPLAKLDTATAMMIQVSATGGFTQEFFPLRITQYSSQAYSGLEWELWVQKTGDGIHAYYLGIPNPYFLDGVTGKSVRSLSVQVVGTSPLTGREDFSGGVDVTLQAQVEPPLIPGFLNLSERFFPTLLPQNFIENNVLDIFSFQGKRQLVLMTSLQMDSSDRIPVSLEKHWDAKSWVDAVVENLLPDQYFIIRGGCFYSRNHKLTHWFGGTIGLEVKNFRQVATEKIKAMGANGKGAWVFWLDLQGQGEIDKDGLVKVFAEQTKSPADPSSGLSIRHPMMHRLLSQSATTSTEISNATLLADLPAGLVVGALTQVAQILASHQVVLHRARSEPAHAIWSELANPAMSTLEAFTGQRLGPTAERRLAPRAGLESDIRKLYLSHGEILRVLEARFDETYGYSSWDAVGHPLREALISYLAAGPLEARLGRGQEINEVTDSR
jgi:hypothetical protein